MGKLVSGVAKATVVGSVLGNMFKTPKLPEQTAPTPMPEAPDSNDETVRAAKRKKAAELQGRSGRLSTMLSDGSDTLG